MHLYGGVEHPLIETRKLKRWFHFASSGDFNFHSVGLQWKLESIKSTGIDPKHGHLGEDIACDTLIQSKCCGAVSLQ